MINFDAETARANSGKEEPSYDEESLDLLMVQIIHACRRGSKKIRVLVSDVREPFTTDSLVVLGFGVEYIQNKPTSPPVFEITW